MSRMDKKVTVNNARNKLKLNSKSYEIKRADIRKRGNFSKFRLIDAVKEETVLWDCDHENYHNRDKREEAWLRVGHAIWENFDKKCSSEQQEIAREIAKSWKNVRDCYLRNHRRRRGRDDPLYTPYIYEKELEFVFKNAANSTLNKSHSRRQCVNVDDIKVETKLSTSSMDELEDEEEVTVEMSNDMNDNLEEVVLNSASSNGQPTMICYSPSAFSRIGTDVRSSTSPPEIAASSSLKTPGTAPMIFCQSDPDAAFFESIKPHLQKFTNDQKLDFQIAVLRLLRDFNSINNSE